MISGIYKTKMTDFSMSIKVIELIRETPNMKNIKGSAFLNNAEYLSNLFCGILFGDTYNSIHDNPQIIISLNFIIPSFLNFPTILYSFAYEIVFIKPIKYISKYDLRNGSASE